MTTKRFLLAGALLLLAQASTYITEAQEVTRSQVNSAFMKAQVLQNRGNETAALETLADLAELVPNYPPIYRRQAEIYDALYQKNHSQESLQYAVVMYRKYLTLEFDQTKIAEPAARLHDLENLIEDSQPIVHFVEAEEQESQEELQREDAAPIVTSDAEAHAAGDALQPLADEAPQPLTSPETPAGEMPPFSFLKHYNLTAPHAVPSARLSRQATEKGSTYQGIWVSDEALNDGRERWIMEMMPASDTRCDVKLSPFAGVVNKERERQTLIKSVLSYMKSSNILANTTYEVANDLMPGKLEERTLTFSFDIYETYTPSENIYKWARNLVSNVTSLIPLWSVLTDQLNSTINKREATDIQKTNTYSYTFKCTQENENMLNCEVSVKKTMTVNGTLRIKNLGAKNIHFYRATADYSYNDTSAYDENPEDETQERLFAQVKADAEHNAAKLFPLAMLHFYGIGTQRDEKKAVKLMTRLATKQGEKRAKVWLANYYYHEAYNNQKCSTGTRRKYRESAIYWMNNLRACNQPEWYGLKGDIMISDDLNGLEPGRSRSLGLALIDSVAAYYRQGAALGDPYSAARLGHVYLWAVPEKQDLKEAETWLKRATEAGNAEACLDLGRLYWVRGKHDAYLKHVAEAADQGLSEAYTELAQAYLRANGKSYGLSYDFDQAYQMRLLAQRAKLDGWIPELIAYGYDVEPYIYK